MDPVDEELASPYEDEFWTEMAADTLPAFDEVLNAQEILASAVPDSTEYNDAKALIAGIQQADSLLEQSVPVDV